MSSIESTLVSDYEDWYVCGTMCIALYDPILVPGVFPEDVEQPESLILDYDFSKVELYYADETKNREFKIELKLLEEIK